MQVQFVCTSGRNNHTDIGIGHLKRCLKLATKFKKRGYKSDFLVFGNDIIASGIEDNQFINKSQYFDFDSFLNTKKIANLEIEYSDFTFVDISNPFFLEYDKSFYSLIKVLKANTKCLILIDGLGGESYINKSKYNIKYDFLLAPYFGAENYFVKAKNHLLGPDFFISEENISGFRKKIKKVANNVCVTCGGSDPYNITYEILRSIFNMKQIKIKLKVIIGPNFYAEHVKKIKQLVIKNSREVEYINSPKSIKSHIECSDIVIATSGLTKYEILCLGTPSIIIPFDEKQFKLNEESSKTGAFLTLNHDKISCLGKELYSFIKDRDLRSKMSNKALELIDGQGINRIINYLGM